jgi:electron transfer flavoprotein alpha subunit
LTKPKCRKDSIKDIYLFKIRRFSQDLYKRRYRMAQNSAVLICGEQKEGKISAITKELLGIGKSLSKLNGKLCALIIGSGIQDSGEEALVYGADTVYLIDDPLLSLYNPDSYTTAITQACQQIGPSVVLLGHTTMGCDVATRVAFRLKCFPCMNCINLDIDPDSKLLVQTMSVYGGNAIAAVVSKDSQPQLATIKPRAMTPLEPDSSRKGEIENINVTIDDSAIKTKLVSTTKEEMEGIQLEDAKVIVSGGGGIGDAEGLAAQSQSS